MRRRNLLLPALLAALGLVTPVEGPRAMASASPPAGDQLLARPARPLDPVRSLGAVHPLGAAVHPSPRFRASDSLSAADTIPVFTDDLESLVSPGSEGGWAHQDLSGAPPAWGIDSVYACGTKVFWCGRIDSSWTGDPNRRGYANSWDQTLENFVDLAGATPPYTLSFNHRMNAESGFDFGEVSVFDPDDDWIELAFFTGSVNDQGANPCDVFTVTIPDSIPLKINPVRFRFRFASDIEGSSEDGLYPNAEGWAIDDVTVTAGVSDVRFLDDMETGPGTWTISSVLPAGDYWRTETNVISEEFCTSNTSRVWRPSEPTVGGLAVGLDNALLSPPVSVSQADQVFLSFDVYRDLPLLGCYYYEIAFRTRNAGAPVWSSWVVPDNRLYFGDEREWLRQTLSLVGAGGVDSLQFRIRVKDYAAIFCSGNSDPSGTDVLFDNFVVGVVGSAGPSLAVSELDLVQDTYRTTPFFADDNLNTAQGDSVVVRVSAANGLKAASLRYSLNGAPFASTPLLPAGGATPGTFFADVPAGSYPRGTELRYYFSATDSLDLIATLPPDATTAGHYFTATVLPAIHPTSATCADDEARVLFVNAHAGPDARTAMDSTLAAIGLRYDRYDVNAAANGQGNTPGGGASVNPNRPWPAVPIDSLGRYHAIVWDVGDRSEVTLTAEDQTLVTSFLAFSGKKRAVLLFGDNLAYDLVANGRGIPGFLDCSLGAQFTGDIWETSPQDSLSPTLRGTAGTIIAQEPFPILGGCPSINRFDALTASTCAGGTSRPWVRYPNQAVAAVERTRLIGAGPDSGRSFLFGFSFAATTSAVRRNVLLFRTLIDEAETPGCYVPTSVESGPRAAPRVAVWLGSPVPNPFNPTTIVPFRLETPGLVRLRIFDVTGALVRTLVDRRLEAGPHQARWDGLDDHGRGVRSGTYFCRLEFEGGRLTRKAVLLR